MFMTAPLFTVQAHPFNLSSFFLSLLFFPACTMKHPFLLPSRISARWVASTRTHENWKKTWDTTFKIVFKEDFGERSSFILRGGAVSLQCVLSPCHKISKRSRISRTLVYQSARSSFLRSRPIFDKTGITRFSLPTLLPPPACFRQQSSQNVLCN